MDRWRRRLSCRLASPRSVRTASLGSTPATELSLEKGRSFRVIRRRAAAAWDDILSRVEVSGSTEEQRVLFYTSMYRVFLSPLYAMSFDGRYAATDGTVRTTEPGTTYYSGWSMWDTFRTKFPMFCVLAPEEMNDMCRSLVSLYCTGKKNWATNLEGVPTVRTEHTQITLLDAWSKGIRDFDMAPAFPAMEREYEDGLQPGSRQGLTCNSPDQKMETIYDLWAMSRIAGIIGNSEAQAKYGALSDELFTPLFTRIKLSLPDGTLTIRRFCGEASAKSVSLNGRPLDGWTVKHADLFSGNKNIVFE